MNVYKDAWDMQLDGEEEFHIPALAWSHADTLKVVPTSKDGPYIEEYFYSQEYLYNKRVRLCQEDKCTRSWTPLREQFGNSSTQSGDSQGKNGSTFL